jgi:hypothetical protein
VPESSLRAERRQGRLHGTGMPRLGSFDRSRRLTIRRQIDGLALRRHYPLAARGAPVQGSTKRVACRPDITKILSILPGMLTRARRTLQAVP